MSVTKARRDKEDYQDYWKVTLEYTDTDSNFYNGTLKIETPLIKAGVPIEDIGFEDEVFDNSGVLPRYLKIFRLPTENPHKTIRFSRLIDLKPAGDNPIFIRLTQQDGTLVWTSPIYVYR